MKKNILEIKENKANFSTSFGVGSHYLEGAKALVVMSDSKDMVGDANTPTDDITIKGIKEPVKFVKRGQNNNLPAEMSISQIHVRTWQPEKNPDGSIYGLSDF